MTALPIWAESLGAVAAALVSIGTIYRYVWPAFRAIYRLIQGAEEVVREYQQSGGFAGLYKELHPNGGGSLRDAVDAGRDEAQRAAADARAAVEEARRIGQITRDLRGYAEQSREDVADLRRGQEAINSRVSDHRRRNDEAISNLREFLETEYRDSLIARQGLESAVSELLMVDGHEERVQPTEPPERVQEEP